MSYFDMMFLLCKQVFHISLSLEGLQDVLLLHHQNIMAFNILFEEVFLYSLFCSLVCTMLYMHKWKNWIALAILLLSYGILLVILFLGLKPS